MLQACAQLQLQLVFSCISRAVPTAAERAGPWVLQACAQLQLQSAPPQLRMCDRIAALTTKKLCLIDNHKYKYSQIWITSAPFIELNNPKFFLKCLLNQENHKKKTQKCLSPYWHTWYSCPASLESLDSIPLSGITLISVAAEPLEWPHHSWCSLLNILSTSDDPRCWTPSWNLNEQVKKVWAFSEF